MTITTFEEQIVLGRTPGDQGYYPPRSIIRTPGNTHLVTASDLSAARGNKEPEGSTTNNKPRLCMMECGMPAALGDVYCKDCRSKVDHH